MDIKGIYTIKLLSPKIDTNNFNIDEILILMQNAAQIVLNVKNYNE